MPAVDVLERTPATLRDLVTQISEEDMNWQPHPDRWSIAMVLAHLADVELKGFMSRFRDIMERENPVLPAYDQLALFRNRNSFDGRAELDRFSSRRADTLAWLQTPPASASGRTGRHEELGVIRFDELLNEFAFHDLGHIRQIIELYRSIAFYPKMGAFQSYYRIHP